MSAEMDLGDWHMVPLGAVADISRGTSWGSENERRDAGEGALPVLGIRNVQARLETDDLLWLHGLTPSAVASSTVQTGDILMVGSNGNPARIGNAVQVNEPGHFLYASLLFGIRPRRDCVDPDYLYQAVVAPAVQTAISDEVQGTTGLSNLKITTLRELPINLPPLNEQRRIAEVLRSADEAIASARSIADQARTIWQGLTERLIWDPLEQDAAVGRPLGAALSGSDYGVNASLSNEPVGHAILRMGNLQDGFIDATDLKWAEIAEAEVEALALGVGDILFNRTNSRDLVGKVALVRESTDFLYASYIVRLRVNRSVADPYYLFAVMHSRRAQARFKSIATPGVSQSNINPTNLKKQTIPLPALAEQREVAAQLQAVEATCRAAMEEVEALHQIKADLMSDLLSGRVRMPA